MPVLVDDCHFLYDLFDVLICGFDNAIHLWPVRGRIMVLDLELHAQCGDHSIVEIRLMNRAMTFSVTKAKEASSIHFVK